MVSADQWGLDNLSVRSSLEKTDPSSLNSHWLLTTLHLGLGVVEFPSFLLACSLLRPAFMPRLVNHIVEISGCSIHVMSTRPSLPAAALVQSNLLLKS